MGGGKSKPVLESARSVIARRKKELPATISESVSQTASDALAPAPLSTISYEAPGGNDSGFSAMTLHQMSNMGEYVVSTSYQNPKPHGAKIVMASMVRHAEDQLNIKPTQGQGVKGRLTEGQIVQIFSDLRHTEKSFKVIAEEHHVDLTTIRLFSRTARMPVIYNDKETEELMAR